MDADKPCLLKVEWGLLLIVAIMALGDAEPRYFKVVAVFAVVGMAAEFCLAVWYRSIKRRIAAMGGTNGT